ncbi:MAG: DUF104 domain-containing protein [Dehalococcoidia bacterium]|nr:DUF104 domain-containing protein [Dehalococcoidia bacterium]
MATIRARYEKGVLTPLEPLELEEGKEVIVSVEHDADNDDVAEDEATKEERFRRARGSWKGLIDGDAFIKMIYESRITGSRDYPRE